MQKVSTQNEAYAKETLFPWASSKATRRRYLLFILLVTPAFLQPSFISKTCYLPGKTR